jgi:hypothetical protein
MQQFINSWESREYIEKTTALQGQARDIAMKEQEEWVRFQAYSIRLQWDDIKQLPDRERNEIFSALQPNLVHNASVEDHEFSQELLWALIPRHAASKDHNYFVSLAEHRSKAGRKNTMRGHGFEEWKNSKLGRFGWEMLEDFIKYWQARENGRSGQSLKSAMASFVSLKMVEFAEEQMMAKPCPKNDARKRKVGDEVWFRSGWYDKQNKEILMNLVGPLLPDGFTGTQEDPRYIRKIFERMQYGFFEKTGVTCKPGHKRACVAYEMARKLPRKNGEMVCQPIDDEWALFMASILKIRLAIVRKTATDDVEVVNNDKILKTLHRRQLEDSPGDLHVFKRAIMLRRNGPDSMLRAVRKYDDRLWGESWGKSYFDISLYLDATPLNPQGACFPEVESNKLPEALVKPQVDPVQLSEPNLQVDQLPKRDESSVSEPGAEPDDENMSSPTWEWPPGDDEFEEQERIEIQQRIATLERIEELERIAMQKGIVMHEPEVQVQVEPFHLPERDENSLSANGAQLGDDSASGHELAHVSDENEARLKSPSPCPDGDEGQRSSSPCEHMTEGQRSSSLRSPSPYTAQCQRSSSLCSPEPYTAQGQPGSSLCSPEPE